MMTDSEHQTQQPEKTAVIINTAAGAGKCGKRAGTALADFTAENGYELYYTERPGHCTELARTAFNSGIRRFWSVGGDGTTFELINGLFPEALNDNVEIGILPLGTGNSFLRDFNINSESEAMDALTRQKTKKVDVIRLTHSEGTLYFINIFSIGFAAEVAVLTNKRFKPFGPAGYVLATLACLMRLKYYKFVINKDKSNHPDDRACAFLSFCNSKFTGGTMKMAPHADTGDGKVDIIRCGTLGSFQLLRAFPSLFKGSHLDIPKIEGDTAQQVDFIDLPQLNIMIDGETYFMRPISLEVLPNALDLKI